MAVKLFSSGNQQQFLDCGTDLSADYHTYSMEYRQGSSIKIFFDDSNVYTYTRNVPVGPYFIILSNEHRIGAYGQLAHPGQQLHAGNQPDAGLLRARPGTVEPPTKQTFACLMLIRLHPAPGARLPRRKGPASRPHGSLKQASHTCISYRIHHFRRR